ncbi:MAG: hypothetical protein JWQ40_508 [Segetibacter sp.]|nr:hypothetical protein [Segetibacter sp.]
MVDLQLQDIYIYPIKSLGGLSVQEGEVQETGLRYDRRWMLTDKEGNFLSQRTHPQMALLQVSLLPGALMVAHKKNIVSPITIPFDATTRREVSATIWDDACTALEVSTIANEWFSEALQAPVQLVVMPSTTRRLVDPVYAKNNEIVSFADGYPFLLIGQASLDDLNGRLEHPLPMNRFRPNLVFNGGAAFCEDSMHTFRIGNITFAAVKPCSRCVITTTSQELATKGTEPLKTLSCYRAVKNKIIFGQNLLHSGSGVIKVGDKLTVQQWR